MPPMSPVKLPAAGTLSDRVVRYLVDYIRRHRLTWGAQMPSEIRLSVELEVSRGIIREAFRSLAAAGILEIANGRAPRVGRLNNRAFVQFLQHALYTEQASQEQVFDVRSSIEVRAAEIAALTRSEEDVEALRHEAATMRTAIRRREAFVQADVRFHEIIGRATDNPLFSLLGNALRDPLDLTIRAGFDSRRTRAELNRVVDIHAGIAEAIAARSPVKARRLMTVHFAEARQFVLRRPTEHPKTRKRSEAR
jgi:DNA-binding FadR family transcriptional regulator